METAIMVRDTIFWWIGNWAIFTALDAALWMGWKEYQRRRMMMSMTTSTLQKASCVTVMGNETDNA